jgi:hypothetical protein
MKRFLNLEETNYVVEALNFYKNYGPNETVVANYNGSYPNDPSKAIRRMDVTCIPLLIDILRGSTDDGESNDTPVVEGYYKHVKEFAIEGQWEGIDDATSLAQALLKHTSELMEWVREHSTNLFEEYNREISMLKSKPNM